MALIGEMHYLTIGGNTYSIPVSGGSTVTVERALTSGTKSATISVDGTSYDLYAPTPNAGTVTSVRVQATSPVQSSTSTAQSSTLNTTISLANGYGDTKNPYASKTKNYVLAGPTTGSAAAPSFRALVAADIPDLSDTYLTSYTETDPTVPSWAKASTKPTYTASEVGAVATSAVGAASGVVPLNASSKIDSTYLPSYVDDVIEGYYYNNKFYTTSAHTTQITGETGKIFVDLSTNKTYRYSGSAFIEVSQGSIVSVSRSLTSGTKSATITVDGTGYDLYAPTPPTVPTNVSAFTNDAGYITSADVPEGASAYTGTISAVSTSASNGTNNGFARGDHVHNITSNTITSALGYTPYDSSNPNGYISSYTDEKLKWTASTTSNTFYPLQSTSTATTSTANTLNGISFYQYYNTAGGYRRLILGNSTAYTSTGGAYGTIRLYGTGATYYGDINPGTLGANRIWTLPNATGTIALTSDIPDVSSFITDAGVTKITTTAGAHNVITNATGAVSFNIPTKTSHLTNDSNFVTSSGVTSITLKAGSGISLDTDDTAITTTGTRTISHADTSSQASSSNSGRTYIQSLTLDTYGHVTGISTATESVTNTDTKLQVAAVTSGTTYYPIVGTGTTAATRQYDTTGFIYVGTNGTANGTNGNALLTLGNSTASTTANWKKGTVRLYGTTAYYTDLVSGAPSANRTITFPNATGTVALTSQIPTVPSSTESATTGITIAAHGTTSIGSASNWSAGTASTWAFEEISIPNVTAAGSASTWAFEEKTIPNVTSAGTASSWTFEEKTIPNVTAAGSGSFTATVTNHVLSFSHTHTAPTIGTAIKVQSKSGGSNGTAPTLGTAIKVQSKSSGSNGTAPTLGTAIKVQSKKSGANSTVPSLTVTSTTVTTGTTHSITDNGHSHAL